MLSSYNLNSVPTLPAFSNEQAQRSRMTEATYSAVVLGTRKSAHVKQNGLRVHVVRANMRHKGEDIRVDWQCRLPWQMIESEVCYIRGLSMRASRNCELAKHRCSRMAAARLRILV